MNSHSQVPSPAATPVAGSLRVSRALIEPVLSHPSRIRNVCILAHVDHGKTTLTDSLLASNGIISFKQAGRLRYMDSREDEQQRGITMQASAITLLFDAPKGPGSIERYAINLIDSPGHVDFSRQVVTAARLVDGCLLLVDAVEGVCTQTMAVLRQARRERLRPCLVINKIDRLITELKMTTADAATWLFRLLEQVNAVQASIKVEREDQEDESSEAEGEAEAKDEEEERAKGEAAAATTPDKGSSLRAPEEEDQHGQMHMFDPLAGNVIFASSTDGWAFTVERFVELYAAKLDMKAEALRQTLWGDYFFDSRNRRVLPKKAASKLGLEKPMFAQFVLDPIWAIYDACVMEWNEGKIEKIFTQTGSRLPLREMKNKDGRAVLRALMGQWQPLAETIFSVVVAQMPSPLDSNRVRLSSLIKRRDQLAPGAKAVIDKLGAPCIYEDEPLVAFISKFFSVTMQRPAISRNASLDDLTETMFSLDATLETTREKLIGMGRVFHGKLKVGQTVLILGEDHVPGKQAQAKEFLVTELYLLMGRDLEPIEVAHAGTIFGIGGLADLTGKYATISSSLDCPTLAPAKGEIAPIVQVAIRPAQLGDLADVERGLQLLCKADPCAETFMQEENGEHILATAGELHLEQCLKDLRERYTKGNTELIVSPPIVPFRESISCEERSRNEDLWRVHVGFNDQARLEDGLMCLASVDGRCRIGIKATGIPEALLKFILHHRSRFRRLMGSARLDLEEEEEDEGGLALIQELEGVLQQCPAPWKNISLRNFWALGPHGEGPNVFLSTTHAEKGGTVVTFVPDEQLKAYQSSILTGFQLVTEKGPLANEPMHGVAFILETFELCDLPEDEEERCMASAAIASQLISLSRTAFEAAFLFWSPRLMLAVYKCSIQTTADMLGKVYSALGRRHGQVISEDYHEGTGFFTVNARLPVVESFGFADDLRGRTAGVAIPQLVFAGFETLPEDPYWVPSTEEEIEEYGHSRAAHENLAMKYLIMIRERKGLFVERKIVQFAEKQRTLRR